jgi:hypothetical protein
MVFLSEHVPFTSMLRSVPDFGRTKGDESK